MGDPLSVTASVVGIVAAAVQGVQLLSNTIERIRNAPEAVQSIQDEIQQLKPILTQLESAIKEGRSGLILGSEIKLALENCHRVCIKSSESLEYWTRHSTDSQMSKIDSAKIGILRQDQVRTLKEQLNGCTKILNVTLDTANYLKMARQEGMIKELGDQMLGHLETLLSKKLAETNEDRKAIVRYEAEALESSGVGDKQDLIRELGQQRATIDAVQGICEKALKTVVSERTGQTIRDVKATDNSMALTGLVNAEEEEIRIEQDISQIAADGRSIAVAGVVNNVDFTALYSQMQQPK
ncbi:uncharacterized protein NECHADRAFT_97213 [Fusarium vanettenii 77-13-4]|uniref:Azaphilone pigments biosynthesis cluster protein L N-terminal domain-containing protein n=1 Tax=Fusarium vanettenii (strain ATCC MYA-4622 / CBS 123669 / FGSC 9596 / NRRL 45880 / 77-13-4) TaxID=660122 RepID=C7ZH84_FUSV7|nr:uncharacterized protein NECHADRAFT_97213 [Fusarium vanettenii 77-13-4]EEU36620.1 hypothetical protein NECHADRAFT_97213 [Fusarium vanettenii 77-13-4]